MAGSPCRQPNGMPARPKTQDPAAPPAARPARNAADTRARILAAARVRFALDAYENVGTRDVAADAGVDAALVNRYFGSKERLFDEAITDAFAIKDHFADLDMSTFGALIASRVFEGSAERREARFDALGMLLRASGSPATSARVAARFQDDFVLPLARLLRGRDAPLRAALIASYLLGLATMRHALGSPLLADDARRQAVERVGAAIQACVDG